MVLMANDFLPHNRGPKHIPSPEPHRPPHHDRQAEHHPYQWAQPAASAHVFRTPEEMAAEDNKRADTGSAAALVGFHDPKSGSSKPPKKSFKERLKHLTKKQWIIIAVVAVLLLGGIGYGVYALFIKDDTKPPAKTNAAKQETPKETPKPTVVPSKLTGLPVPPENNERQVTGIMIENSTDARPQSGLNDAGVVFEAIAEGGITRFLTLFQDVEPEYVGPVRSVRPYYVQWAVGFDAAVAHVGGSADGLALVRANKDLDQFANSSAFWRVSNRYAPHNMYTSIPKLNEVENKRGYTKSNYTGFARKEKETPAAVVAARSIDFNISSPIYNPHYDYDPATNSYKRSEGGKPHTDEKSGAQLSPKVVVALVMTQGKNGIYTTYSTIGSGKVYVFQDGAVTEGTWTKDSNGAQFVFKDAAGNPLPLNPGQTWLSVVGSPDRVKFAP